MTSIKEVIYFYNPKSVACKQYNPTIVNSGIPITKFNVKKSSVIKDLNSIGIIGVPGILVVFGNGKNEVFNGIKECNQFVDYIRDINTPIPQPSGEILENEEHSESEELLSNDDNSDVEELEPSEVGKPGPAVNPDTGKVNIASVMKESEHDRERIENMTNRRKKK